LIKQGWEVKVLIKKIPHITFPVSDLKRAVDFYENVLGLKKTGEWGNYAIFDVGGVELALEPKGTFQIYLLVDDVDEAYNAFKEKGVKFVTEPKDQYWGGRTAEFADLDGNKFIIESFKK
jgi:catechol 2,3-dioxygenase-like lactoylglutathione lyase family enzyme